MVRSYSRKGDDRLRAQVDEYISKQGNNTFNYKQVAHAINATSPISQRAVALYLAELAFDGDLLETAPGRYKSPSRSSYATGTFVRRSNGKNSVVIDDDKRQSSWPSAIRCMPSTATV